MSTVSVSSTNRKDNGIDGIGEIDEAYAKENERGDAREVHNDENDARPAARAPR